MVNLDRLISPLGPLLRGIFGGRQAARQRQFEAMPRAAGHVVFLGDSITEQGPWDGWFPELPTLNRGIGGNAVCHVMARLDSAIHEPQAISLMIGTNDLHGFGKSPEVRAIADQMRTLVQHIRETAPAAKLLINSVTPRSTYFRDRILQLNGHYQKIAVDNNATYIDLWPAFAAPDGSILRHFTPDGLHLSGEGYKAWTDILRPHLAPFAR